VSRRMDALINDMMQQAASAATAAWKRVTEDGSLGVLKLPTHPTLLQTARMFFLAGYALALTDHTMNAAARLKAAGDADEQENVERLQN